jgi:hypothetical protein
VLEEIAKFDEFMNKLSKNKDFKLPTLDLRDDIFEHWKNIPVPVTNAVEKFIVCFSNTTTVLRKYFAVNKAKLSLCVQHFRKLENGIAEGSEELKKMIDGVRT